MIGQGLAEFTERREKAHRGGKLPGAALFTKGVHDL